MTSTTGVDHDVEYQIARLLRRSRMRGMESIGQVHPELDFAAYLLLLAVNDANEGRDGVRGTELADAVGVHKSTVSRGLSQLHRLGLVEREIDPSDGRARLVRVTETAASRLASVRAARRARLAEAIADWDEEDLDALARLLDRLNDALEEVAPTA
ncbi:UNVERIFIED_CONTAM: hypothetical protein LK11_43950 [Mumia flava]|nr:MarR family winged helix-turn-helix transcriptional regulator [Mumia flava]